MFDGTARLKKGGTLAYRDALTEGKVGKEVKDQAINIPDVMSEPRHYGMHRHFTQAGCVVMWGGGMKRGHVYGATADERPTRVIKDPVTIEDLHATIYRALAGQLIQGASPDGWPAESPNRKRSFSVWNVPADGSPAKKRGMSPVFSLYSVGLKRE